MSRSLTQTNLNKNISDQTLVINNNEIPLHLVSDYKVFNTKTYVSSPVRSNDGSIGNINDYDVFFVPRIIITFNFISFEDYVFLNEIINSSNEYYIGYYDTSTGIPSNDYFYLTPEESEKLLYVDGSIKGIQNLTLSFVGTLNQTKTTTIGFFDENKNQLLITNSIVGERVQLSSLYKPTNMDTSKKYYWYDEFSGVKYYYNDFIILHKQTYMFRLLIEG